MLFRSQTERVALSRPGVIWGSGPSARELLDGLIRSERIADPLVRDEAARLYIEGEILRLLAFRSLSDRMQARPSGPEGAVRKIVAAPHGQRVLDSTGRLTPSGSFELASTKLATTDDVDETVIRDWIRQAAALERT